MESDDDDIPQLSAETFAALQEFYKEEDDREVLKSEAGGKNHVASCDMNIFCSKTTSHCNTSFDFIFKMTNEITMLFIGHSIIIVSIKSL